MMSKLLTYGTFDLFHVGHVRLLKRLKGLTDKLVVGVSTDEFNSVKGKQSVFSFEERREIVSSCRYVDEVIAETCWEQKAEDIRNLGITCFAIGDDWAGHFDFLSEYCEILYLPRTEAISTTKIKQVILATNELDDNVLDNYREIVSTVRSAIK